ncbi:MAG TPA: 2-succinyl-5-enolpyruvyl-6-hydroxy-3-cyclohexene-1-carboxylic-acid synthase, partial [Chryseolinea sp.]|nr:2-succinyl-5-enolpyruvyl-6-hydroxy-3-cyclohexene-1-carboxylic-acid synthase [Chryseolinea sp.]
MRLQPIYDIAELCSQKGITHTVLCPGSRCAPLTLAFARHPKICTRSFSDERSAGFIALGMAQSNKVPTVLVCTSGSAAYNFAPSVAEAFFNQIPLIVFSADRPSEWVAQQDGQTIYQNDLFGKHVKKSFQLPQEYDHTDNVWSINRIVNEAINLSRQEPQGPVHINAPFREPLYPSKDELIQFTEDLRVIEEHTTSFEISTQQKQEIINEWPSFNRILVVAGQGDVDADQIELLINFTQKHKVPIAGDILSNLNPLEMLIRHTDLFLGQAPDSVKKTLQPELLITFGKSVLSKNLKVFLRNYAPKQHWHIQEAGVVADAFQHVTHIFRTKFESFFHYLNTIPQ